MESNHRLWVMSPTRYPFSNPPAPIITTPDRWWHSTRGVKTGLLSGTDNPANRLLVLISLCRNVESNHGNQCFKLALFQLSYLGIKKPTCYLIALLAPQRCRVGIEPTYSGFIVDQMRIELTTGALQVLLAPLDHAGPWRMFTRSRNLSKSHPKFEILFSSLRHQVF